MMSTLIFNNYSCTGVNNELTEEQSARINYLLDEYNRENIPVLPAFHRPVDQMIRTKDGKRIPHPGVWCIWCVDCDRWHEHGTDFGHRVAHCFNPRSRYDKKGYVIAYAGEWQPCFERRCRAMRRYCTSCPEPHPCGRDIR